jgi:hypothetical protein
MERIIFRRVISCNSGRVVMGQKDPIRHRMSPIERLSRPSFEVRISLAAKELEAKAWQLPPGAERDAMLRRARQLSAEDHLPEWLTSPGLQSSK